jgi:hypothetical protein
VPYGLVATAPIDYLAYVNGNTTGGQFSVGDLTVTDNPAVFCNIAHIYSTGGTGALDGLVCTGNTFFFPPWTRSNTDKLSHILLNTSSDMLLITGNQFFESGYESINVTDPRNLVIQGNNLIWSAQRDVKDAIAIRLSASGSYVQGVIDGNNIAYFTKNAVSVYGASGGTAQTLKIGANQVLTDNTAYTQYYGASVGGGAMPTSFTRYYSDSTLGSHPVVLDTYNPFGKANSDAIANTTTGSQWRQGIRLIDYNREKVVSVTAATVVFTLSNAAGSAGTEGGLIIVTAQDSSTGTHQAVYLLAVSYSGTTQTVTTVAAAGETTGAAASSPSFTWTLNGSNGLLATPVASTTGSFTFYAKSLGNLRAA